MIEDTHRDDITRKMIKRLIINDMEKHQIGKKIINK